MLFACTFKDIKCGLWEMRKTQENEWVKEAFYYHVKGIDITSSKNNNNKTLYTLDSFLTLGLDMAVEKGEERSWKTKQHSIYFTILPTTI